MFSFWSAMNDSNDSCEAAKKDDCPKKSTRRSLNSGPTTGSGDKRELVKSRNFTHNRNLFSFEKKCVLFAPTLLFFGLFSWQTLGAFKILSCTSNTSKESKKWKIFNIYTLIFTNGFEKSVNLCSKIMQLKYCLQSHQICIALELWQKHFKNKIG